MENDRVLVLLLAALMLSVAGILSAWPGSITGNASMSASTTSSAVISKYFSINVSGNLSSGIDFGTIAALPSTNVNATRNWNSTINSSLYNNQTLYWATVETDSNTPVDFCITATAFNTSTGYEIDIGNYTFADSNLNDITHPGPVDEQTMSKTAYVAGQTNIGVGSSNYFRFWLDVPATTASGTYNNTVTFLGRPTGTACP
jgi:hypothetical protein